MADGLQQPIRLEQEWLEIGRSLRRVIQLDDLRRDGAHAWVRLQNMDPEPGEKRAVWMATASLRRRFTLVRDAQESPA